MFGLFSKSKKYIKEYEQERNVKFPSAYKKMIEDDFSFYLVREEEPKETSTSNFGSLIAEGMKNASRCVCYTDEQYDKYARAIVIFYARYVVHVYKMIDTEKLNINEVHMKSSFFKAIYKEPNLSSEEIRTIVESSKKADIDILYKTRK